MKFNFEDYKKDNYAMHCRTKEEVKWFCKLMDEDSRKWHTDDSYLNWELLIKNMVYYFNKGTWDSIDYVDTGTIILEASDFMSNQNKPFTKSDLKAGMVVENDSMGLCLVVQLADGLNIKNGKLYATTISLDNYADDLTYKYNPHYNINKVYDTISDFYIDNNRLVIEEDVDLLYEREQKIKITRDEIRNLLGTDFELID